MPYEIVCSSCGSKMDNLSEWRCKSCRGPFKVSLNNTFSKQLIKNEVHSMWRYAEMFPWAEKGSVTSFGEGGAPMVRLQGDVFLKLEYVSPTGSFKDRGTSMMFTSILPYLKRKGVKTVVEDSSGNAGASISAYSAYLGLQCHIYTPKTVSGPKAKQIEAYGARLVKVKGSRDQVAKAAEDACREEAFYASHVLNPFFSEGMRTVSYEIAEDFDWKPPDYVFLPCSAGTLLLGVVRGFKHLLDSNMISETPTIVAAQSEQVSPVYHAVKNLPYEPPSKVDSVADALASVRPTRLKEMVEVLKLCRGEAEIASDAETLQGRKELSKRGFYVEPSSAVAYACYAKWRRAGRIKDGEKTVVILSGAGFKSELQV